METVENRYQRRAIAGDRHFILADPQRPDLWALPGPVVLGRDASGACRYGPARTAGTARLRAWARDTGRPFRIEERFPVLRRSADDVPGRRQSDEAPSSAIAG